MAYLGDLQLEGGGVIKNLKISYVTHGKLNAAKDNAVLALHGFAANHHWADHLIGPGRPLDTDKYFIICPDELGNPQTTFEHSTSPTNSGLKMNFPQYNERDRVKTQYLLVTQALGIPHLLAVTGLSSGADDSVQMAVSYPGLHGRHLPDIGRGPVHDPGVLLRTPDAVDHRILLRDGTAATTTRIPSRALPTPSRSTFRSSTPESGGNNTSTRPRRIRSGATRRASTTSTSRMHATSTIGRWQIGVDG